jgi:curved DNA-binding protein CbpA
MDDPYKVLGLALGAGREQIDRAYRTLVRRYPPELNPERFALIHDAYDRLRSFERTMEEVRKIPEAGLDSLFPVPRMTLRPFEPTSEPLRLQDLEPLLRPLRRLLLARLLRRN